MGVGCDRLQRGFSMGRAGFILLAGGTSSYIIFGKGFHFLPLIGLTEEVYGIRYSWVTCERMVVVCL